MTNFYNSIGLVGIGGNSYGCGILSSINKRNYVLTCEHILREVSTNNPWFQFALRKTFYPACGFLRYECKEAQSFSFSDLTLLETGIIQRGKYLNFDSCEVFPGECLFAFGYPVTEAIETLKIGIDEPFPPIKATGIFKGYSEKVNLGNKTNKPEILINNVGIVEILRDKGTDFSGYSGGLIATEDNRPIGMIVGEHENHLLYINIYNALNKV